MKKIMTFREKLELKKREENPEFIKAYEEAKQDLELYFRGVSDECCSKNSISE
ncbi:hypothetical protein [Xenorhabdus griffiniae]|uniref:Transcriptional regulator n=1 Tax=Xenorhabdus griffiniae TaxID=351672 RepID=A0ABY9XCM8_9GAMM|nr:hypothetical protein [Xenorhabdus griffiniae]MBD1226411.1 hypothetical protein [Xenorhabdus griffiniae]MBE8588730.1 hypothetical protein [Xenorhabdus griffiniae]WMV70637.1 hypothetical protein QL128_10340 [Xenorhabdus griffiniae]WNH00314.1 hypothetical protein QL112_010345 [Xenorhabdus griffiniae]